MAHNKKKSASAQAGPDGIKVLVRNRAALHDYHIHERIEAGIVLCGSEVKSLREAHAVIGDAYVEIRGNEAWLVGASIKEYPWANQFNHEPGRHRKLLLHKREILRLAARVQQRGQTVIPLAIYLRKGRIKVELGVATGKRFYEKREAAREADARREIERAIVARGGRLPPR